MSKFPKAVLLFCGLVLAGFTYGWVQAVAQQSAPKPAVHGKSAKLGLGREAHSDEIKAWDIDVSPSGAGLPPGQGTVKAGEELYQAQCAACHGEFGESVGRWPVLAGGAGSLKKDAPEKTVGSYWPYTSSTFDYIKRAMPYGNARSLSDNEVYAVTAYVLFLNDIVKEDFELSKDNFTSIKLPNEDGFIGDDRETAEKHFWLKEPCMKNCKAEPARITGRARAIDVTPEGKTGPKVE